MGEKNTAIKNGYSEVIPVNIYGCRSRIEDFLNTHDCQGCKDLIGPVETIEVPRNKMVDIRYISKISKSGSVTEKPNCKRE